MGGAFGIGELSKAKEDWVLITTARIDGKLHGFTFSTLERIGGTPCVLLGLMSVKRTSKRDQVLRGLMGEAYHRALMAFPDEDVVVGSRFVTADALEAFKELDEVTPRPGTAPSARSGHGVAGWPSASASRRATTRQSFVVARRTARGASSTTSRPSPRSSIAAARRSCSPRCRRRRAGRWSSTAGRWPRISSSSAPLTAPSMAEFADVVRRRRMTRAFDARPGPAGAARASSSTSASRAPSAGKTQGWHLVVLEGAETARFWDITLPADAAWRVPLAAAARRAGHRPAARRSRRPTSTATPSPTRRADRARRRAPRRGRRRTGRSTRRCR